METIVIDEPVEEMQGSSDQEDECERLIFNRRPSYAPPSCVRIATAFQDLMARGEAGILTAVRMLDCLAPRAATLDEFVFFAIRYGMARQPAQGMLFARRAESLALTTRDWIEVAEAYSWQGGDPKAEGRFLFSVARALMAVESGRGWDRVVHYLISRDFVSMAERFVQPKRG